MIKPASLVAFFCCFGIASAKCPMAPYLVKGKVVEYGTGIGLQGAKVFVFLDHPKLGEREWAGSGKYPDWTVSADDGSFEAQCTFLSDRLSFFRMHDCRARPKRVVVLVVTPEHLAKRKVFQWKGLSGREEAVEGLYNMGRLVVRLPDITMRHPEAPPRPCPGEQTGEQRRSGQSDCS